MRTSDEGLQVLRELEGFRAEAYRDERGTWTIGYGDTHGVKPGDVITLDTAEERLRSRVAEFEQGVHAALKRTPTQSQFDVLVSLAYNIGGEALRTSSLLKLFNNGDIEGAARQLGRWIYVDGPEVLVRQGDRSSAVSEWQRRLIVDGFNLVRDDGVFGPATDAATRLYQGKHGLTPDGVGRLRPKVVSVNLVQRRVWDAVRFMRAK